LEPEQFQQVSTPPAAAASMAVAMPPPQPASAGIVEQLPIDYLTRVMMTIGLNRRYPLKALANREKGTVVVHIHLSRDGSVLDVTIIRSSGSAALDAEALDVVWRIAKFQALSPEYARGAEDFAIDQPIRFSGY
jgi:protein TonB